MIDKQKILDYYSGPSFWPVLPLNYKRRLFKGQDINGKWKTKRIKYNKDISYPVQNLVDWIINYKLVDVFYTKNEFLNPLRLTKSYNSVSDHLMVREYAVADIDYDFSRKGIKSAFKDCKAIVKGMKIDPIEIVFTGSKGFRVVYDGQYKQKLFKLCKLKKIKIDQFVLNADKQIIRLPDTINSKSGLRCITIPNNLFKRSLKDIMSYANPLNVHVPEEMPTQADEMGMTNLPPVANKKRSERSSVISPSPIQYVTNRTGRLYVVFIKHKIAKVRLLRKIQQKYRIGTLYGFKEHDGSYLWISLSTFDSARLRKILTAADSINLREFNKFGKVLFATNPKPTYIQQLAAKSKHMLSQEHLKLMFAYVKDMDYDHSKVNSQKLLEIITAK